MVKKTCKKYINSCFIFVDEQIYAKNFVDGILYILQKLLNRYRDK